MSGTSVLERARHSAGLSQHELAVRAHTSRTAVSAYEHGHKSPSLDTLQRLLAATGFELDVRPQVRFRTLTARCGQEYTVPDRLPELPVEKALAVAELPLRLNWSQPGRVYYLANRDDRSRVYETVLREGSDQDILTYVDGTLLVDLWQDLVLPQDLRAAWEPLIAPVWSAA